MIKLGAGSSSGIVVQVNLLDESPKPVHVPSVRFPAGLGIGFKHFESEYETDCILVNPTKTNVMGY